jgi:hypothetical protein
MLIYFSCETVLNDAGDQSSLQAACLRRLAIFAIVARLQPVALWIDPHCKSAPKNDPSYGIWIKDLSCRSASGPHAD